MVRKTLSSALTEFVPHDTIDELTAEFRSIAQSVFSGYFCVNNEYEIHPVDIEFYFHDENGSVKEERMYHKGNLPFFKLGTLCPNASGVDVTFEKNEGSLKYRASFLIRGYKYISLTNKETYVNYDGKSGYHSRYIWDDLFGNASFLGNGLSIIWVNSLSAFSGNIIESKRVNIQAYNTKEGDRPWRFSIDPQQK